MQDDLDAAITGYLARFPDEQYRLRRLVRQLAEEPERVFARDNMRGHITSSVLLVNEECAQALLVFHRALQCWLAPGGHYEGTGSLAESAARELAEETGLKVSAAQPMRLLDIDSHEIPPRPAKGERTHFHHDFLFLAHHGAGGDDALVLQLEEVTAAQWLPVGKLAGLGDTRLARVGAKLQAELARSA